MLEKVIECLASLTLKSQNMIMGWACLYKETGHVGPNPNATSIQHYINSVPHQLESHSVGRGALVGVVGVYIQTCQGSSTCLLDV